MTAQLIKLDKRHNGHSRFSHMIEIGAYNPEAAQSWLRAREYCWSTFGPSCELEWALPYYFGSQPLWAYSKEENRCRIYLTEQALTQFLMVKDRWGI